MNDEAWAPVTEHDRIEFMDACFAYDEELKQSGHNVGGESLQGALNASTLRWHSGNVSVTDGPFAETKEQIGGIMIL
jgi:hypothetical protein